MKNNWADILKTQMQTHHGWDMQPKEARRIQREWSVRVNLEGQESQAFKTVTGVDVHYHGETASAAAVTLSLPELEVRETRRVESRVSFPYVSGLLAFREIPALLPVLERLETRPEIIMTDGHGVAHPRRFGLACHLGVLLDIPTVGVARKRLWGLHASPGIEPGACAWIMDQGQRIGSVLRTRRRVAPVFVSAGHRINLERSIELVMACLQGYRMPEPLRLAGILAG